MSNLYTELAKVLPLPDPFLEVLQPTLEKLGYEVELRKVWDDVEGVDLVHHRVEANGSSVALLHVVKNVIHDPSGRYLVNTLVENFVGEVIGLFCFSDTNEISEIYEGQANNWMNRYQNIQVAKFIKLEVIDKLKKLEPDGRAAFLNNRLILSRLFPLIRAPRATTENDVAGPSFVPHVVVDELEGLFAQAAASDFLDVGTIQGAMRNVNSVCLVKINNTEAGTGFLIADDLVLTNHHVMSRAFKDGEEQIKRNASRTTLHFGHVSTIRGEPAQEKVFKLHPEQLIVAKSVDLDFALLRVEPAIKEAKTLRCVEFAGARADKGDTLHMLQHPLGQVMQLTLSGNAVTYVSEDQTRLEYLTPTAKGSSGSPCFNQDWEVVALHRAAETRRLEPVGLVTIKQGVPFKSIYETIKEHLE